MICGNYVSDTHDVITVHPHEREPNTYVVEYGKESIDFLQAEKQEKIQEFIMERLENDIVMFHFEGKKLEVFDRGIEKRYKLEK